MRWRKSRARSNSTLIKSQLLLPLRYPPSARFRISCDSLSLSLSATFDSFSPSPDRLAIASAAAAAAAAFVLTSWKGAYVFITSHALVSPQCCERARSKSGWPLGYQARKFSFFSRAFFPFESLFDAAVVFWSVTLVRASVLKSIRRLLSL